jgi:hypothetical protein
MSVDPATNELKSFRRRQSPDRHGVTIVTIPYHTQPVEEHVVLLFKSNQAVYEQNICLVCAFLLLRVS